MKRARHLILLTLSLCLFLSLCACGGSDGPETAVNRLMQGVKALDDSGFTKTVKDYTGNSSIQLLKAGLNSEELRAAATRRLSWQLHTVQQEGNTARVEVTVTNADFASIVPEYYASLTERLNDSSILAEMPEASVSGLLNQFVDSGPLISETLSVSLTKVNGIWIADSADNLVSAALNNAIVAFTTMGR